MELAEIEQPKIVTVVFMSILEKKELEKLEQEIIKILKEEIISNNVKYISFDRFHRVAKKITKLFSQFRR